MKKLVKNYSTPKVNSKIIKTTLEEVKSLSWVFSSDNEKKVTLAKDKNLLIFSWVFASILFVFFAQNMIKLNLSYMDILLSWMHSIGIFALIILNVIVWTIYFMYQNILSIIMLVWLYYFWVLYIYWKHG